jgi:hypothetical protein
MNDELIKILMRNDPFMGPFMKIAEEEIAKGKKRKEEQEWEPAEEVLLFDGGKES